MRYSPRITLALVMLEAADPDPVANAALTDAFGCAAPETSNTMARMRELGLVERIGGATASYRLSDAGRRMQRRIAGMIDGTTPLPPPTEKMQ